ncbi:hypothetical protein [Streptomyces cacaoi]
MPMPPQGSGGGKGKKIGIAVGAVVVVGAVIGGLFATGVIGGGGDYKLTAPQSIGEFKLKGEPEEGKGGKVTVDGTSDGGEVPGLDPEGHIGAKYTSGTKLLEFNGAYGTLDDPEKGMDWLFDQMSKKLGKMAKPDGDPKKVNPSGFDGDLMKCQEYKVVTSTMSVCAWADDSTIAVVVGTDQSSGPLPAEESAELTAKVYSEARVKK